MQSVPNPCRTILCTALAGVVLLGAAPAHASSPIAEVICAPSDQMTQRLQRRLGAERRASGIRSPEEVMELWTDPQGAWAMVISYASGQSCIVAMGDAWAEALPRNPA